MVLVNCYNKGCGQKYDPDNNSDKECIHHPGVPVFHDALKGWSCCKKRSTDFTEFLNIPGCTVGTHSNEKPAEPVKSDIQTDTQTAPQQMIQTDLKVLDREPLEKKQMMERPPLNSPKVELSKTVAGSLTQALEKQLSKQLTIKSEENDDKPDEKVKEGTSCKNNSCKSTYENENSNLENCKHHPGVPIFHEGMKYWTCCKRKTSDFDVFLNQEGCESGRHLWVKTEDPSKKVACRQDWHQTGSNVIVSVFSKLAEPEKTWIKANPVSLNIYISFENGQNVYEKDIILQGIIDPKRSSVKMFGTKVEITLRKAEPGSWSSLELKKS